jgi:NADPH:quinone reductase
MHALICDAFAPIDALRIGELPDPVPGPGEVVIRVAAAGVNFYDTLIVQGKYQLKPPAPFSPGGEVAGTIASVGPGVSGFSVGDRVCAFTWFGGYAQLCRANVNQTWRLADDVSFEAAAAGLVAYGTAWFSLYDRARMQDGETVLVLGAAGGVGLATVEVAHAAGARVIAAAGSPERLALCAEAGADVCIDYVAQDLKEAVRAATGGRGADIVVDVVGGAFTEAALRATAWRGRILIVGFAAGDIPRIPANLLLLKGCEASGVFWDEMLRREPDVAAGQIGAILQGFADGRFRPRITGTHALAQARDALFALARREAPGKLIIKPT